MADDIGPDRRDLDLVVFADQVARGARHKRPAACFADARSMISAFIQFIRKLPVMRLMAWLRPARTRVLPRFLLVGRGRLRRRARVLLGALEPKHQFDQLLLAEPLQITPIHPDMDSEIDGLGKGWVITRKLRGREEADNEGEHDACEPDPGD